MSKTDYLTEDNILPYNQKFMCISFLSDPDNKITLCGIKVRGVFETYELACEHAKKIQSIDPYFNVFVGECGKWLAYDPNPESEYVKDSEYANEELNSMMKSYVENQEKAKLFHEQRKTELIRKNILDNLSNIQTNLDESTKKMKKSNELEKKILKEEIDTFGEQIKKLNSKKSDIDEQLEKINEELKAFHKAGFKAPQIIETEEISNQIATE